MKKLKLLLVVMFAVLMIPVGVFAEESGKTEEVNVYFFKGDGCGYCEAGLEWFDEIEDRYGERFILHEYETWYDEDNAGLMEAVAEARGEEVQGVPYIIVGNQSWNGFDESYEDEILDKIRSEYKTAVEERYDIMDYVEYTPSSDEDTNTDDGYADDIAITVLLVVVVAGVGLGIYSLRKSN